MPWILLKFHGHFRFKIHKGYNTSMLIFKYQPILSGLNADGKHQLNIGMAQGSKQRSLCFMLGSLVHSHIIMEISLSVLSIASVFVYNIVLRRNVLENITLSFLLFIRCFHPD